MRAWRAAVRLRVVCPHRSIGGLGDSQPLHLYASEPSARYTDACTVAVASSVGPSSRGIRIRVSVTPDGRGWRESMNPRLVAPTRRDHQIRVVASIGPPSGELKRPSTSSPPCPFSSSPSVLEGYVRAVPSRSTSPDPQPFRFSASCPSHTHTRSRPAAIWAGMSAIGARDPDICYFGLMDALPRTLAHPMSRHRPRRSDDTSSTRFRPRCAWCWRVGPIARLTCLLCL